MIYTPETINFEKWDQARPIMERNWKHLEEIDERAKNVGQLLYRYVSHSYADGKAFYQIIKENKKSVRLRVCTGLGDDWILPAWGEECSIPKTQAETFIKRRDGLKELFSQRR
jgi:hypothetical protein